MMRQPSSYWRAVTGRAVGILTAVLLGLMALAAAQPAVAQSGDASSGAPFRPVVHITSIGAGRVNQLDTYLSPLEYTGLQAHYLHQRIQPTSLLDSCVQFSSLYHVEGSYTQNQPNKANDMGGSLTYDATWHYRWQLHPAWTLMAGPQLGGTVGFLYNTRNGNNPAQALANVHLSASVAGRYEFRLWHRRFAVSDQMDIPVLGAMFSPNYGQSYYELFSEGNTDHNVCFTTPFNAPTLRNQLCFDFSIRRFTFRATYLMDIRQSHVNNIKHHSYTHALMLGWVKRFNILLP